VGDGAGAIGRVTGASGRQETAGADGFVLANIPQGDELVELIKKAGGPKGGLGLELGEVDGDAIAITVRDCFEDGNALWPPPGKGPGESCAKQSCRSRRGQFVVSYQLDVRTPEPLEKLELRVPEPELCQEELRLPKPDELEELE